MLDCYLLAICRTSSLDRDTNNFSLTQLVETVQVQPAGLGQAVSLELHFYLEVAERALGQQFELRILWVLENGEERAGNINMPVNGTHRRTRTRTAAIMLPPAAGKHHLAMEWRVRGTQEWNRFALRWPLELTVAEVIEGEVLTE